MRREKSFIGDLKKKIQLLWCAHIEELRKVMAGMTYSISLEPAALEQGPGE